ncbi:MAG TPA: hypothetical protein VFY93_09350 [Planctomycetota bacterium]|nr:hypothetical protein [Planctomycetota bacterium]
MAFRSRSTLLRGFFPALLAIGGCRAVETHATYPQDLYHPDYVKRSKAVAIFAEKKDRGQLPEAFELLLDDDGQIRLVAYGAIRDLSPGGEDFGYRPYLPSDVRFGIVTRWQAWWTRTEATGDAAAAAHDPAAPEGPPAPEAARG